MPLLFEFYFISFYTQWHIVTYFYAFYICHLCSICFSCGKHIAIFFSLSQDPRDQCTGDRGGRGRGHRRGLFLSRLREARVAVGGRPAGVGGGAGVSGPFHPRLYGEEEEEKEMVVAVKK